MLYLIWHIYIYILQIELLQHHCSWKHPAVEAAGIGGNKENAVNPGATVGWRPQNDTCNGKALNSSSTGLPETAQKALLSQLKTAAGIRPDETYLQLQVSISFLSILFYKITVISQNVQYYTWYDVNIL